MPSVTHLGRVVHVRHGHTTNERSMSMPRLTSLYHRHYHHHANTRLSVSLRRVIGPQCVHNNAPTRAVSTLVHFKLSFLLYLCLFCIYFVLSTIYGDLKMNIFDRIIISGV